MANLMRSTRPIKQVNHETKQTVMKRILSSLSAGLALLFASTVMVSAGTSTWDGDTDTFFSTSLNWDTAPSPGDALVFPPATSYTVDFTGVNPNNGPITFNAASDYYLTPAGQTLTLSGNITQSGAGAVSSDIYLDLGGATRTFGGGGGGVVRFNGTISGTGAGLNITGGSYALAAANSFDGGVNVTGGTLKMVQAGFGGDLIYQPTFDGAGSGNVTINGGRVELIAEDALGSIIVKRTNYFGASGGTLVYSNFNNQIPGNNLNANVVNGPATFVAFPARLSNFDPTGSSANDNLSGCFQLQNLQGTGPIMLVLRNGASARWQVQPANVWTAPTFTGPMTIDGQPGGDVTADQSASAPYQGTNIVYMCLNNVTDPYHVPAGIKFTNACQLYITHSNQRTLASDVTVLANSAVAVQGRPQSSGNVRTFTFGYAGGTNKITIQDAGLLQADLQISRWVNPALSVIMNSSTILEAGGTLRFARTYDDGTGWNVQNIAVNTNITGQGTAAKESVIDLLLDNGSGTQNGVTFNSGVSLVVNGTGTGGLRIQAASAAALANLMTGTRYSTITGSGGVLTLALTNNDTLTNIRGPASPSAVALGLDSHAGSSPTYVFSDSASSLANYAGLVLKGGTAVVNDSSTISMQTLKLASSATLQMGTAGGSAAVINFANSSAVVWNAGTLTIANWNGSVYGGGPDQIKVGTAAGGLTAAQLAQIKWLNPFGAGDVIGAYQLASGEIVPAVGQSSFSSISGHPPTTPVIGTVEGSAGVTVIVQANTNLSTTNWVGIATNALPFNFTDYASTNYPMRFYRVWKP